MQKKPDDTDSTIMLGRIQDLAKEGLWASKVWQVREGPGACSPRKILEHWRCHFPGFQGEFEAKKGGLTKPIEPPIDLP